MRRQNIVSNEIFTCELSMAFIMALNVVLCSTGAPSLILEVLHQVAPRRLMCSKTKPIAVKVRGKVLPCFSLSFSKSYAFILSFQLSPV